MILKITTPAVLFSTISLLMSAYIARFSTLAKLIRDFSLEIKNNELVENKYLKQQIDIFTKRILYIKYLQVSAIFSLFCSTLSMFLLLFQEFILANIAFIFAVICFLISLIIALIEIYYSIRALSINLKV